MPPDIVAIIGGTGSFGHEMTRFLLHNTSSIIRIYSRSELLQAQMLRRFKEHEDRLRFFIGDVRDLARLTTALAGVKWVWHAAALKHVDILEYNPTEAIATNIYGTENVISACRATKVERSIFISSDKSVQSINIYGNTKAVSERLWTRANAYAPEGTAFSSVRYGNVLASRGSATEIWRKALEDGKPLTITDHRMTRFDLSITAAVELAWFAANNAPRGSIMVPHLPAYSVKTLAQAVVAEAGVPWEQVQWQDIGKRPGEKLHEILLTDEEAAATVVYTEDATHPLYYCIPPVAPSWRMPPVEAWQPLLPRRGDWQVQPLEHPYRSDVWAWRLTCEELRARLKEAP